MENQQLKEPAKTSNIGIIKSIIFLLLLFFVVVFVIQNSDSVKLDLIISQTDMPLSVLLLLAFLPGFILGLIFWLMSSMKHKKLMKEKNKEIEMWKERVQHVQAKIDEIRSSFDSNED